MSPGQVVVASLSLASSGQAIAAIEFDLQWVPPLGVYITAGDQLRAASKIPYSLFLAPQTVRFLVAGLNGTPIADGELLKLFLFADPAASAGTAQIQIANVTASDPTGVAVPVAATAVNVQIVQNTTSVQSIPANAVLNAASLSPGPLSPGEIITLFGFFGQNISLTIDGVPAPILYSGTNQINAIVPFELNLTQPATVQIQTSGQSISLTLPVAAASPAIFTQSGQGLGSGSVLNQDYTVNSANQPAAPGSIVMVYGTGFGLLNTPLTDGASATAQDRQTLGVTATVAGLPADMLYAGTAPGLVAGVTQINVRLPGGLAHNLAAPLVLTIPGVGISNSVIVAVQ